MQPSRVRALRQRKLELYASMLPAGTFNPRPGDADNDMAYAGVLREVARIAPPGFGLEVGRRRRLKQLDILAHVTLSCGNLCEARDIWVSYANAAGELLRLETGVVVDGPEGLWSIDFIPHSYLPKPVADLCIDEICAMFFGISREITGRELEGFVTELPHPPEPGVDYGVALRGEIRFGGHERAHLVGPSSVLELPIIREDDSSFELLVRFSEDADGERGGSPTRFRLYDHFVRRRNEMPSVDGAARALGLSRRTLTRRLAEEGTSFGEVLDDYRRRYALALFKEAGLQAKRVAHLVGFRNENSLRKAMRRWTGRPIGAWCAGGFGEDDDRSG